MRFSIVMPTRNQAGYLAEAVESVLGQEGVDLELTVYDALSDDGTAEILGRYADRIVWRRAGDHGQVDAVNRGLREARGDILAWLNSDDVYLPGALAAVRQAFRENPRLAFAYGDALEIDRDSRIITPNLFTEECDAGRYLHSHNFICQPALFIRRSVLDVAGAMREDLKWVMDYEWFGRFFLAGLEGRRLPLFLAANRDYPETKTNTGGFRRWMEIMRMFTGRPGPPLLARRCTRIYTLELVVKTLNSWAGRFPEGSRRRGFIRRRADRLAGRFLEMVSPRSQDDIVRRFQADILPRGASTRELWARDRTVRAARGQE